MPSPSTKDILDRVGLPWVTLLLVAAMSTMIYLAPALWQTWSHTGTTLVTAGSGQGDGFVAGHDFVAFYSASAMALGGDGALAYDEAAMKAAQHRLVGDDSVGYLAFMYPPTYLLLIAPLSTLPYFPALALWLVLPLLALLLLLRRGIDLPPPALFLVLASPAVAQSLFAGQNGLLLAALLAGGFLLLERSPLAAGAMLGLATVKPQLALLILPALVCGAQWRALAATVATVTVMAVLATLAFGTGVWEAYIAVPAQARDWLAEGRLPWTRMPTVYTALRLAGLGDLAASLLQGLSAAAVLATVGWAWWKRAPRALRIALPLAGAPLATPFMYDYDLPLILPALGLYMVAATAGGWRFREKLLLLAVWLQPAWWWTLATTAFGVSVAPAVYGIFFFAVARRAFSSR